MALPVFNFPPVLISSQGPRLARSQRLRQSLSAHREAEVPADGSFGRSEHFSDNQRTEESRACLLPVLAEREDTQNGWRKL